MTDTEDVTKITLAITNNTVTVLACHVAPE